MATGMVLIIVSRNIDLSVGSMLGFTGMLMAILQAEWLTNNLGLGLNHPLTWIIALAAGLLCGALIGGLQGFLIAYVGIPSFIVTLGGLLVWRGFAWTLASGRTIAPLDATFLLLGGGPRDPSGPPSRGSSADSPVSRSSTPWSAADGVDGATASRSGRCGPRSHRRGRLRRRAGRGLGRQQLLLAGGPRA